MKVSYLFPFVLSLLFLLSCNNETENKSFKDLAGDENFKKAHDNPEDIGKLALTGDMIHFPTASKKDGSAYLVKSNHPGRKWLIVFHEWWGLNDYIKREADRYANSLNNVNVLALDLYDGKVTEDKDEASKLVQQSDDKRIEEIINGALKYVGDTSKIATLGWCFGGGWSLQTAILAGSKQIACVMYYGMPETSIDKIKKIQCPVFGVFAKKDKGITPSMVIDFSTKMKYNSKSLIVNNFDAEHAFANPSNPHFNKMAAEEANSSTLHFLKNQFKSVY